MQDSNSEHHEQLQQAERIAYLIAGHLNNSLNPQEQEELDAWITESDANLELFERLTDEDNIEAGLQQYLRIEKEKAGAFTGVKERIGTGRKPKVRRLWPAVAAAAVIGIGVGGWLLLEKSTPSIEKPIAERTRKGVIDGGGNKAVLTLSDGRTIILDSAGAGAVASEGTVAITYQPDGLLAYEGEPEGLRYNTVATPRGGQYKIRLGDGTTVWLNAESYLRFPAGLAKGERNVELRGEGFFEVAKDAQRPFTVRILKGEEEKGKVTVLGTRFNINGFADEGAIRTTLVEGKVKVEHAGESQVLRPGEQAVSSNGTKVVKADVSEETAWVDGRFLFRDASIRSIGEQIRRWYDVEVDYRGENKQLFNTEAKRNVPLQKLLKGLEGTGLVHFTLEGRKLIISP